MDHSPIAETLCPSASPDRWTDKFERQVEVDPTRAAVVSEAGSVSYGELSARSNQIANLLRSQGIGRGHFVGLGLHRCLDLPAALLGILKSGAAYVPLDPGYPTARIEQMISSAKLEFVVTNKQLAGEFPNVHTLCVDDQAVSDASSDELVPCPENDNPIYAIFTSGSTGQPKAASVYHREFANLLHWYSIELKLGPTDRTLVISSPSFDLTQKNFFAPLITGGTLILDDCQTYDISRITALIRHHGVTLINCTPSAFYPLVDGAAADGYASLASLRFAVLGGEPISISRLRGWLEHPDCRAEVVNTYGPTEGTDICTFHRLHRGNLDDHSFLPLGREIPNLGVSILDESRIPLPNGEIGELFISGTNLGAGYLNDAARTTLAYSDATYRTGDKTGIGLSMESKILGLWSEVLDHRVSDAAANFFDLGGNSIHVAIIHVRLMEMVGRKFPISGLFALPTARGIAEYLAPKGPVTANTGAHSRARLTHAGFSRFRDSIPR